jgi:hypothetical protein
MLQQPACSVRAAGGEPKNDGVACAEQERAQTDVVPGEGQEHRKQRHEAHTDGDPQKKSAPCGKPEPDKVQADDAADNRVDLLLCSVTWQQQCRRVHTEEFSGDGDEVNRHSEERSRGGRGRFESPEPHDEDQGHEDGKNAARANVGTRYPECSKQRPERAEEPADQAWKASAETRPVAGLHDDTNPNPRCGETS